MEGSACLLAWMMGTRRQQPAPAQMAAEEPAVGNALNHSYGTVQSFRRATSAARLHASKNLLRRTHAANFLPGPRHQCPGFALVAHTQRLAGMAMDLTPAPREPLMGVWLVICSGFGSAVDFASGKVLRTNPWPRLYQTKTPWDCAPECRHQRLEPTHGPETLYYFHFLRNQHVKCR